MYIDRKDSPPNGYQSGNSHCSKNSYTYNALGSVIALTDETGAIKTQYIYDPYGNVTISGEASDNPFQYTGRENDGTGLYYYRIRYYSSELQRFISEDPIGFAGGDVNLYGYVFNSPINWVDPLGLEAYYGNWCGGDWTGGKKEQYTPHEPDYYKDPIDELDTACQTHDICYYQCRKDHPCDEKKRSECFRRKCDTELNKSAKATKTFWGDVIGASMKRPGTRDPGPNDPSCKIKKTKK